MRKLSLLCAAVALFGVNVWTPSVNAATLIGTSVTSNAAFSFNPGPVAISNAVEFFTDGALFTADFSSNALSFKYNPPDCSEQLCENVSFNSFSVSFTDAAFLGANISLLSDTFPLIEWTHVGGVLTLSVPSTGIPSLPFEAQFSINPVPIPPAIALFATGLCLMGLLGCRRKKQATT